jgi:hypothetical protein
LSPRLIGADGGHLDAVAGDLDIVRFFNAFACDVEQDHAALGPADLQHGLVQVRPDDALAVDGQNQIVPADACVPGRLILVRFNDAYRVEVFIPIHTGADALKAAFMPERKNSACPAP